MDLILGVVYGTVQGLTEFLPVSSSGHLALLPKLMNFTDPGVSFDLWLHVGTALAIIVYFKGDLFPIVKEAPKLFNKTHQSSAKNLLINLIFATFISFIFILFFKNLPAATTRTPMFISINLIVFGLLMWLSDVVGKVDDTVKFSNIQIKNSLLIGLFQAVAIFPGVSRSGVTLTIARYLGIPRHEAANFSFILSLPIVLGGMLIKVPELLEAQTIDLTLMSVGLVVSFVIGILSIHFFLKLIKKVGLGIFCFYRIILAVVILSNL